MTSASRPRTAKARDKGRSPPSDHDASSLSAAARRLLTALAQENAGPARSDLRDGFLVVAAPRNGITAIVANAPVSAGEELVGRGLARWASGASRSLAPTAEGRAMARRLAAPEGVDCFRAQHVEIVHRTLEPGASPVAIDAAESPLCWLARRKGRDGAALLSPAQVEAGERYRRDVEIAQLRQRVTLDWSGAASSGRRGPQDLNISEMAIAARQRLERAGAAVGPDLAGLLTDVCGLLKGLELVERERAWPPRSAKVVLRIALDRLAAHYGLASEARGPARPGRMRNWGAPNYRPKI